jgi:hypothetical protein
MKDDRKPAVPKEAQPEDPLRMLGELVDDDGELIAHGSYAVAKYQREQREKAAASKAK